MIDEIPISCSVEEAQSEYRGSRLARQVKRQIIIVDIDHYDCGMYKILCSVLGQRLPLT